MGQWDRQYDVVSSLAEDAVWRSDIAPLLGRLPENVLSIWQFGVTEMLNNVIDHSGARRASVSLSQTAAATTIDIHDDGVGIFKKIQAALRLEDERHAVLELAKGKFTTDPANHSGEGVFFASRVFDQFVIASGEVFFSHDVDDREDWILQAGSAHGGTLVRMVLHNGTARTLKKVFDRFTADDDYGFTKTVVPVKLMRYGDDNLVSRSQAKRLTARFEKFRTVILDFTGVESIGQGFADELFRVFATAHPATDLVPMHMTTAVQDMTNRVLGGGNTG